jgi:heterodisulfide reductase subunit C2
MTAKREKIETTLYDQVAAITGGERLKLCLQCGTCGGSCPSGPDMEHTPREIFAMLMAGQRDEVLRSNTYWYCVSCYYCTVRCPQQIPITAIMYQLKHIAAGEKKYTTDFTAFSRAFINMVENFGRGFELGLATQCYMMNRPLAAVGMMPMALGMLTRGRMALLPTRIKDLNGLKAVLRKAKQIARQRDQEAGVRA